MSETAPIASAYKFKHALRVRRGETDRDSIVLCSSLFSYMDVARTEYLRNLQFTYPKKWQNNFYEVVASASCEMKRPAHFDDELLIFAKVSAVQKSSFAFEFKIYQAAGYKLIAQATSSHVVINPKKWEAIRIPDFFRESVSQFENKAL
ncbi:MAG: acyl-CoA thioesterase [Deltaproteobacteria bacterium]|nr:acyl-CoA thioesterase [Deltaproteobacteria bacterium]